MSSTTNLLTVPGDDDVDLQTLKNFALTVSWASKAILEVFYDEVLRHESAPGDLVVNGGELTTPVTAAALTSYTWGSKYFPLVSGAESLTKATMDIGATTYGLGGVKVESTLNSGLNWYTWYDTDTAGTGTDYPDGFLDRSKIEKTADTVLTSGQTAALKVTITTDSSGFGGAVDYIALLTDPDLFDFGY